jgi:hypothetical protein
VPILLIFFRGLADGEQKSPSQTVAQCDNILTAKFLQITKFRQFFVKNLTVFFDKILTIFSMTFLQILDKIRANV